MQVLDLVYLQKLHHIVEQEPVVKYITEVYVKFCENCPTCTFERRRVTEQFSLFQLFLGGGDAYQAGTKICKIYRCKCLN